MKNKNHSEREHARLGGSTAHRWVNCTGSVALSETVPAAPVSAAADRGTYVHEACEEYLQSFLDQKLTGLQTAIINKYDDEAVTTAEGYVKAVWEKVLQQSLTGKAWGIEESVCLDEKLQMSGIVDFWCVYIDDRGKRVLAITDFKNGYHYVEVKKNAQFVFYGCAMVAELRAHGKDIDVLRTCVYQPNISRGDAFREVSYTTKQLDTWNKKYFKAAKEILAGKLKFKIGYWCDFCPAMAVCKTYAKSISDKSSLALMDAESIKLPAPESIPDDKLAVLLMHADELEDFLKAVRLYAINRAKNGRGIANFKIVNGPTRRTWKDDEEAVANALTKAGISNPWTRKLMTITAAEKMVGKEALETCVTTTQPAIILVPDSDPRPSIQNAVDLLK